jgi:flagella basal body P-ring formation protein FlgA
MTSRAPRFVLLLLLALTAARPLSAAEANVLPVPAVTIYPGDVIRDGQLVDREFTANYYAIKTGVVESRASVIGKVTRRTLLPGVPIPLSALADPKAVANGARVRIVFDEGGVVITAYGLALQAGGVGDVISVRNLDSGLTLSGLVQSDGSIRVNGS